ncbi:hypothetical protein GF386_02475 [Candidatus Pacearchaeota archaeon]|nr:hypothetical protein [Candidatus Pacearchaeota archaeon]MBD3283009.1 hypothetical protein [Candidatus Pacearchaeota archaeon]
MEYLPHIIHIAGRDFQVLGRPPYESQPDSDSPWYVKVAAGAFAIVAGASLVLIPPLLSKYTSDTENLPASESLEAERSVIGSHHIDDL